MRFVGDFFLCVAWAAMVGVIVAYFPSVILTAIASLFMYCTDDETAAMFPRVYVVGVGMVAPAAFIPMLRRHRK